MMKTRSFRLRLMALVCCLMMSCGEADKIIQSLMDISGAPLKYDDSQATRRLAIASVCLQCSSEKQENLAKMKAMIHKIMKEKPETELIVFGETILGWYYYPDDPANYQRSIAETIPGPATDSLSELADFYNIYITFGLGELNGDKLYNSQVLINPDGNIEAIHRKFHLIDEDEQSGFDRYPQTSSNVTAVEINGITTGMIICADVSSYWLTEQLVKQNVELIIHSLASFEPEFKIDAVARQFNAWVVFANRYGREKDTFYKGNCYISDPAGTIRVGGNGKERYEFYRIGVN